MLRSVGILFAGLTVFMLSGAQAHHVEMSERAARLLDAYVVVGEALECTEGRLKKIYPFDDRHVLFRMRGGGRYLGELVEPGQCQGLWHYQNFHVETTDGDYCRGAHVTVMKKVQISGGNFPGDVQANAIPGGHCYLGDIYKIERKPKE